MHKLKVALSICVGEPNMLLVLEDKHKNIHFNITIRGVCVYAHCNSPFIKVAVFHTGSPTAEESAGEALIWARTPTAGVRTQRVTHHALLSCSMYT